MSLYLPLKKAKHMKNLALLVLLCLSSLMTSAQFGTAPDFNVTDIDGNEHQLYADILDQGLIAVVEISATWCSNCWNFHQSHALQELHEAYGPNGTNQLRVIFYEADPTTTLAQVQGMGGGTQGDWTNGVTYPIVNESPLSLDFNIWAPITYPTVKVVRPSDREIVLDTSSLFSVEAQVDAINGANIDGIVLGVANTAEVAAGQANVELYPNPSLGEFAVELNGFSGVATVEVYNIVGRKVWTSTAQGEGAIQRIDLGALEAGNYLISVSDDVTKVTRRVTLLD